VNKFGLAKLKKLAKKTSWEGDDIVIAALRGLPIIWGLLLGVVVASTLAKAGHAQLPQHYADILEKTVIVLLILSISFALMRMVGGLIDLHLRQKHPELGGVSLLSNSLRTIIIGLGVLVALQSVGVPITPVLGALGVGGLAVALALQGTLSNFFGGVHLLMSRKIRPGDFIRLDGSEEGTVVDINWRETVIRTPVNNTIIIPNSKLSDSIVHNLSLPDPNMIFAVPCSVAYGLDLEHVERIVLEVATEVQASTTGADIAFAPVVRFTGFQESSIGFVTVFRVVTAMDQYLLKHLFIKKLHARFHAEDIEIPYPTRALVMKGQMPLLKETP
jgi:small-conductance mechanosensitive channel